MEKFVNKWLFFPFAPNAGMEYLIHPDDLENLGEKGASLVKCISESAEYLTLYFKDVMSRGESKDVTFRGKPKGVKRVLPDPVFLWDERVQIKKYPEKEATINTFFWHFKNNDYCYHLNINGKKYKKRYFKEELLKIDNGNFN